MALFCGGRGWKLCRPVWMPQVQLQCLPAVSERQPLLGLINTNCTARHDGSERVGWCPLQPCSTRVLRVVLRRENQEALQLPTSRTLEGVDGWAEGWAAGCAGAVTRAVLSVTVGFGRTLSSRATGSARGVVLSVTHDGRRRHDIRLCLKCDVAVGRPSAGGGSWTNGPASVGNRPRDSRVGPGDTTR